MENLYQQSKSEPAQIPGQGALAIFDPIRIAAVREQVKAHLKATGDPETIAGLDRSSAPKQLKFVIITSTSKPKRIDAKKFDCPYCRHPNQFYDGHVLLCEDGKLRLIGADCAARQLGNRRWESAEAAFTALVRREDFERLRGEIFPAMSRLYVEVNGAIKSPQRVLDVARLANAMRAEMPELFNGLLAAWSIGQALIIARQVRDIRRMEKQKDGQEEEVYREEQIQVHRVQGGSILSQHTIPPLGRFTAALKALEQATTVKNKTAWETLDDINYNRATRKLTRLLSLAVAELYQGSATMAEALVFFSAENLAGICKWANDPDCPIYRVGEASAVTAGLAFEAFDRDKVIVRLPPDVKLPDFPSLSRLTNSLEQFGN